MKFRRILFLFTAVMLIASRAGAKEEIKVSLPNFDVVLNGQKYDNSAAEYPLIVYKGITYIPLSWDMTRFMGLETHFGYYGNDHSLENCIFYAGSGSIKADSLPIGEPSGAKETYITLPRYRIVLGSGINIDNTKEEYPLLNFRGVTYFPLTWHYAYELFDWEYSFDGSALTIDSRSAVRPTWDYMSLWRNLPHKAGRTDYVLERHCYGGYPVTTLDGHYNFRYRDENGDEKIFSLFDELSDGDYYFSPNYFSGKYEKTDPVLNDGILTIMCERQNLGKIERLLITVDMKNEKIIDKSIL